MTGVELEIGDLAAALEYQQKLVADSPNFFAILRGPEHVFEFANAAYMRVVGRPVAGRSVADAFPEIASQGFIKILDRVYNTGVPFRAEDRELLFRDPETGEQTRALLTFSYRPMRDAEGSVIGIYVEGYELSDRIQTAATLQIIRGEAERRWAELDSVYENAPVGLALLGAQRYEYRRLNRVQAEIIGLPSEFVVGKTVREISPSVADAAEALFARVAAGEIIRNIELEGDLPQRPGERRSWLVSYAPIRLSHGHIDAIICTALETTELKRAQQAAIQNEKLAAVGRLAGSIAHEINNPLEAVTNLLFLARNSHTLTNAQEYLDAAEIELRRVAAITTQTLRFYKQSTEPRCVTCDDLIGSALTIYEGRIKAHGIHVQKRKRACQPVLCFDGEIRQVLNNLVVNAVDAMIPAGGRLAVRSREGTHWRTGEKGLWLTIADTGTGMTPETRERIFEPFFTTKGIASTGLGLWISSEILKRHHGGLLIRSTQRPGRSGTMASFFLPFNAVRR